jgi:hypothetical protein
MTDTIYTDFLVRQQKEALDLAESSDVVNILPVGPPPSRSYLVQFRCKGLVRSSEGVVECDVFEIGIQFPSDYLRHAQPAQVLTWLGPRHAFHPSIRFPFICPGRLTPGTTLTELLYQCFEIITYQKVTMREKDALNPAACGWARRNKQRFPIDSRPLKRRRLDLRIDEHPQESGE